MKNVIVNFFLLVLLFGCKQHNMKDSDSKYLDSESQPVIETFFDKIKSGNYNNAINDLLKKNENIDLQDSLTINLKSKFNAINESSGKYISERLLRKKGLANDLGVYVYLVKYEKKFYRFTFTFYNNGVRVRIYKFSFDDNIDIELEAAIKLYLN